MNEEISVADVSELIYWTNAFRVLGIKRCWPAWARIGLPSTISSEPAGVVEAAVHFWRHNWEGIRHNGIRVGVGYADPSFPENFRVGIESLLRDTFAIIERRYTKKDALELYNWAKRFLVVQEDVKLWFIWSMLFSLPFENGSDFFKHAPEIMSRIKETISEHFGSAMQSDDAESILSMNLIPLSNLESRMIALEVTHSGDFSEIDLTGLVATLMRYNHAYQVWDQLNSFLSNSDREALLWWGYQHANTLGISAADIDLPKFV
jgi:hypothetical protein